MENVKSILDKTIADYAYKNRVITRSDTENLLTYIKEAVSLAFDMQIKIAKDEALGGIRCKLENLRDTLYIGIGAFTDYENDKFPTLDWLNRWRLDEVDYSYNPTTLKELVKDLQSELNSLSYEIVDSLLENDFPEQCFMDYRAKLFFVIYKIEKVAKAEQIIYFS